MTNPAYVRSIERIEKGQPLLDMFPHTDEFRDSEHPEEIITRHAVRMGHAEKVPLLEGSQAR